MRKRQSLLTSTIAAMLVMVPGMGLLAQGKPVTPAKVVTGVSVSVDIGSYRAPCPAQLTFTGKITVLAVSKQPITYQWIRSDGVKSPKRSLVMTSTTAIVTDKWKVGRPGEQMRVWKKLQVLTPNSVLSSPAESAVLCG